MNAPNSSSNPDPFSEEVFHHYQALGIGTQATPLEIQEAYLRARRSFQRGGVASYGVFDEQDLTGMLLKVEEAYQILSDPEKRRNYDLGIGIKPFSGLNQDGTVASAYSFSERSAPMEATSEESLIAPRVEVAGAHTDQRLRLIETEKSEFNDPVLNKVDTAKDSPKPESTNLASDIQPEPWSGARIKEARKSRDLSIEEIAQVSRIKKSYLIALEEERYEALPARVFLRGFLIQIAKIYRIPQDEVADQYLGRMYARQRKTD